jgi:membrane fusion protein, macrolide-specific efflux system
MESREAVKRSDSPPELVSVSRTIEVAASPAKRPGVLRRLLRRKLVWAGIFLLAVIAFAVLRSGKGARTGGKTLTAKVKRADLEVAVLETGRIEPLFQTQIKSKVGGQVVEVLAQEGERVKKDQVLLRIDPTDHERDVARMEAEIAQTREALAYATIQLGRAEKASRVAIAPAAELDQSKHEVALARARLRAAEVALATARDRLRYTSILAPFEGTIIQRNVQPGEVVVPGMTATVEGRPLLMLADMSVLLVKTDLNQIDVARAKKGQTAEVTLDALPGKKWKASVTRVAPAAVDVRGRDSFPIEAALEAGQDLGAIKPGMTADVRILIETRPKVLLLPIEAVTTEKNKSTVELNEHVPGKSAPQSRVVEVELGERNDREVEIKKGVSEGNEVLINPPAVKGAEEDG